MELHQIFLKYKALLNNLIFLPDSSEYFCIFLCLDCNNISRFEYNKNRSKCNTKGFDKYLKVKLNI
jgi:hypothetical protein